MKFTQRILAMVGVLGALAVFTAQAQFDQFGGTRSIVLATPTVLTTAAPAVTNGPIDIAGYLGTAVLDINSCTNAGGALTATIQESNDTNTWNNLANFALISATTSFNITNLIIGTNQIATDAVLLPGTFTTPTASTAGFATPYLDQTTVPFTNTGAITVTAKGVYRVGIRAQDAKRYLRIYWTPTGTSSNDTVSAVFTGVRNADFK